MTPQQFATTYLPQAARVSAGTGLSPWALISQWGVETAWGTVLIGCNLGNIRSSPTSFARYASLDEFCNAAIATWHNGEYPNVLLAAGKPLTQQLIAIGQSPWDAGRYTGLPPFNYPAGSLIQAAFLELNLMNLSAKQALVRVTYVAGLGRQPESMDVLNSWANQIGDDGSNADVVVAEITASVEGKAWLERLHNPTFGPQGPAGPAGPQGPMGQTGPTGPQGPPPDATSINNAIVSFFKKLLGL